MSAIDQLLSTMPFVVRKAELSMLQDTANAAANGRGSAFILAGESGVGKTRLSQSIGEYLSQRLRSDAERMGHELGLAWAEAGEALTVMLRGKSTVPLLRRVEAAADRIESIPFVFDAAKMRCEIARRYTEFGDRDAAIRELRRAHDIFVRIGAEAELNAARSPPLTGRAPAFQNRRVRFVGPHRAGSRDRAPRRGAQVEQGSRQGAGNLLANGEHALSNIFEKLGVSSRGELVDVARERGVS